MWQHVTQQLCFHFMSFSVNIFTLFFSEIEIQEIIDHSILPRAHNPNKLQSNN